MIFDKPKEIIMKTIIIEIPDNLKANEELYLIQKQLGKKLLPSGQIKSIGNGYEIRNLETSIKIMRVPTEKSMPSIECGVCKTIFEKSIGKRLFVNYGGVIKQRFFCSDLCRVTVIEICGVGRASIKKQDIKSLI